MKTKTICKIHLLQLLWLALPMLVIPNILFFCGWLQPMIACGASALVITALIFLMKRLHREISSQYIELNMYSIIKLFIALIIILAFLLTGGYVGEFPSHGDHRILRNALYNHLINDPWPVVLPNGKEITYYIAGMLPPAMVSRFFAEGAKYWVLVFYLFSLVTLCYLFACFYIKRISLLLLLMLLIFADPVEFIFVRVAVFAEAYLGDMSATLLNFATEDNVLINAPFLESIGAYNSNYFAMMVAGILICVRPARLLLIPFVIGLLLPISPIGAIAIMPVALLYYIPCLYKSVKEKRTKLFWAGLSLSILLAMLSGIYYLRAENSTLIADFVWNVYSAKWVEFQGTRHVLGVSLLLLPFCFIKKKPALCWTLLTLYFLPFIHIGSAVTELHGANELYLKGYIIYSYLAFILYAHLWQHWRVWRYLYITFVLAGCFTFCKKKYRTYSPGLPVNDYWNGHLNHDHPFLLQSVPHTKDPIIPRYIILQQGGSAEQQFPGSMFPKAPRNIDYNKPHQAKDIFE